MAIILLGLLCMTAAAGGEGTFPASQWGIPAETVAPISSQASAPDAFFFRGGIQWNMSRTQVRALEPMDLTERTNENWSVLIPLAPVEVSRYKADLVYMFYQDQLKMIQYEFGQEGTAYDYAYLTGALDSVYGVHTVPEASEIITLMDRIYPSYYHAETISSQAAWAAKDGTRIYQFYYSATAYTILYANPADSAGAGGYITTGL